LSIRFPLWDPDAFLDRWLFLVRPLFGWFGLLLWGLVVITALMLAASHWVDLSRDVSDRVWAPGNLVLMFFVYPLVKLLHELGHAYAIRKWGGEVHEIGIMLLVLSPVPYVDASASWGFNDKRKRMVVGAGTGRRRIWSRTSGEALSRNQREPSAEIAAEDWVRGWARLGLASSS